MVKLSIIVPVYNVEHYLSKCLDSLVHQTYSDYEIILVNDGSLDQSQHIIEIYQTQYPSLIRAYTKVNGGLSDARNYGLLKASGSYVAFVDSDDSVDLNLYQACMETILKTASDVAVFDLWYEYEDGTRKLSSGGSFDCINPKNYPDALLINNSACNKVFKKDLILKHPFIKGIWYEDLATVPLILLVANSIVKVNDVYYHYAQRTNSIVHTKNPKIFDIYQALSSIQMGIRTDSIHFKAFQKLCVIQGVELTNLRIKDYSTDRIEFWRDNFHRIQHLYPNWYFNSVVWKQGFKKWVVFTLFKAQLFTLMDRIF